MVSKIFNNVKLNVTHSEKYIEDGKNGILHMLVSGENIAESLGKIAQWHGNIVWTSRLTDDRNSNDETNIPTIKALKDVTTLITEHTSNHKYAGSDTDGGAATSALKLSNTEPIGSETKPVYFTSAGIPSPLIYSLNASVPADAVFTDKYVEQIPTTDDVTYELLFAETPGDSLVTGKSRKNINLTFNPKTGLLKATSFEGSGANITNINASNITSGTLSESFLSDTGVVAGTYGPVIGSVLDYEGTFDIPDFSVDAKGRLTVAHTRTFTLPKAYEHPEYTSKALGMYKIVIDKTGHVSETSPIETQDILNLGIQAAGKYAASNVENGPALTIANAGVATKDPIEISWNNTSITSDQALHLAVFTEYGKDTNSQIRISELSFDNLKSKIGLKSAAYTDSTDYAKATHEHTQYYSAEITRAANTVLAAPDSTTGTATFRKLVASDLPSHSHDYLPLTGGTLSGDLLILNEASKGEPQVAVSNGQLKVGLLIGSGEVNRGLYDFTTEKWIVYYNGTNGYLNGNATTSSYSLGFKARYTEQTWGNQDGVLITDWGTTNGADIAFRENNGQLNVITDGFFYQNEGKYQCLDTNNWSATITRAKLKAAIDTYTPSDLNDATTPGFYNGGGGNGVLNRPSGVDHFGMMTVHCASGAYYAQMLFGPNNTTFLRRCTNGTWSDWDELKFTDTVYTHPTTAGYRHIPAGGAAGQFLKYSADGTAVWAKITESDLPPGTGGGGGTIIGGDYLPLTGGTMSGDIIIPYGTSLIQTQREDSNYSVAVKWYHGGLSQAKYDPHIGHHNVGDTDGATVIVPYPTETDPWNQQIGLYISKNLLKFNGTDVSLNGHKHTKADITDFGSYYSSTTSRTANTVLAAPNGSAGAATFRKLVAADLPSHTHLYAKSETAGGPAYSVASVTGSVDKARNVWFSMDSDVNRLAIDDSFLYNPSTKVLDVNTVNAISYRMINITDQTVDLNSYTNENNSYGYRMYRCKTIAGSETISNKPVADNPFVLEVIPMRYVSNADYITKQVYHTITGITYTRICTGGSWSSWTCENDNRYLRLSGGTVTGTLILSKTTDVSGTANNSPALIVGPVADLHLEIDGNEIQAKSNGTTVSQLNLNIDGGNIQMGGNTTIKKDAPKLILQNTSGTAVEIDLNRTGGASWKMINTAGDFIIQNNWVNGAAGTFFNVLKLSYSTGNAVFKGTVTAPTFIGNLTGTADIAKKVKISAAVDDASRYVFFNHSSNDGEVVYDEDFKYNPVTNNLSVININEYKIGGIWNAIPVVDSDGVMEVGKILDFHTNADDTDDYDVRLTATTTGLELNKDKAFVTYVQNRSARLQGGGVRFNIDSASPWAMGMSYYTADGTTGIGGIGMYGTANATAPTYAYIGTGYNNAWMKVEPTGTVTATTFKGSLSGNASTATKLQTARTIDGFSFDGSADINHYATCGTAAGTAAKVATINTGTFTLTTGATVYVKFTNANTVASATLNVNSTGAKPIFHNGAAISASSYIKAGGLYQFVYDGTNWIINAGIDTNGDTKVTQTVTTTNANYEVLFSATANNSTLTETARKNSNLLFNPSTGTLTTTKVTLGSATISYDSTNESLKFTFA